MTNIEVTSSGEEYENASAHLLELIGKGRIQIEITPRDFALLFEEQRGFSKTEKQKLMPVNNFRICISPNNVELSAPYLINGRIYKIKANAKIKEDGSLQDDETSFSQMDEETLVRIKSFFHENVGFTNIVKFIVRIALKGRAEVNDLSLSKRENFILSLVPLTELPK